MELQTAVRPVRDGASWIRGVPTTPARIVLVVAGAYAALCWLTHLINESNDVGVVTRPAAGVAVAAALLVPTARWGWVAAAITLAQSGFLLLMGAGPALAVAASVAACLAAFSGASVTRRLGNRDGDLVPVRAFVTFCVGSVLVGPVVGATLGSVGLQLAGGDVFHRAPHLLLAEMLGVLVFAPVLLAPAGSRPRRRVEHVALYVSIVVSSVLVFFQRGDGWGATLPYVLLPLLAWAAIRFGPRATANCGVVIYLVANTAVLTENSPFNEVVGSTFEHATALRVFLAVAIAGGLLIAAMMDDLVEVRTVQSELRRTALTDPLTGLPNRAAFDQLRARVGEHCTVLLCDLDHFKRINDGYGHEVGDRLLLAVAHRLRAALGDDDHLLRLGGDEFLVLLPTVDPDEVSTVVGRIEAGVGERFPITERVAVRPGLSVGVAATARSAPGDLLRHADTALYAAKAAGRGRSRHFDDAMRSRADAQRLIEDEVVEALRDGHLRCRFQPEVEVASGRLCAVEALVRWEHPERGVIGPDDFVPVMEELGLSDDLFHAVLDESLRWQHHWFLEHGIRPQVSINLSPHQLANTMLPEVVERIVHDAHAVPGDICLELTEGTLIDGDGGCVLLELAQRGFRLAIDDFGTGWASMGRLVSFPWSVLKIDRSFVGRIGDRDADAIVESSLALACSLGIRTVAEGVETPEQLERLEALGCDIVQGYLLGAPMRPCEVGRHLGPDGRWAVARPGPRGPLVTSAPRP